MKKVLVLACLGAALSSAAPAAAQEVEENPCANALPYYSPPIDAIVEPGGFYANINAAVAATPNPNRDGWLTICVNPGSYPGDIIIEEGAVEGLNVHIVGIAGEGQTFVSGGQSILGVRGFDVRGEEGWFGGAGSTSWQVEILGLTVHTFTLPAATSNLWESGGAALRASNVLLTLHRFFARENVADGPGGALSVTNAWLDHSNSDLTDNESLHHGGAVYIGAWTSFVLREVLMNKNKAPMGGGAYIGMAYERLTGLPSAPGPGGVFDECTFENNTARLGGGLGAEWVTQIDVTFSDFLANVAQERGGAVHLDRNAQTGVGNTEAFFNGGLFKSNIADGLSRPQGGAIWTNWSKTDVVSSRVEENTSGGGETGDGGGIYCRGVSGASPSGLNVSASDFVGNSALTFNPFGSIVSRGGALAIQGDCNGVVSDSNFKQNQSLEGGAVHINATRFHGENLRFIENPPMGVMEPFEGGALLANDLGLLPQTGSPAVQLHGSFFSGNRAQKAGGGAQFKCRTANSSNPTVLISRTNFSGNKIAGIAATGLPSTDGGGGVMIVGCGVDIEDTTFGKNEAPNGGGVRVSHEAALMNAHLALKVRIRNSVFETNSATDDGGGIHLVGGRLILQDSGLKNNTALGDGGGLASTATILTDEIIMMERVAVVSNASEGEGNGIFFQGDAFHAVSTLIAHNIDTSNGVGTAAFFAPASGQTVTGLTLDLNGVTIAGNHSPAGGGYLGLEIEDFFSGAVYGSIANSVIAMNDSSMGQSWQALGLSNLLVSSTVSYFHDPSETDPALLTDAVMGVSGANPDFIGDPSGISSLSDNDPWGSSWYNYGGVVGGPIGPNSSTPGAPDSRGAFFMSQWCTGLESDLCVAP